MKKSLACVIPITLLLIMISGLIMGCEELSSVPAPPDSTYPADIIGRVTVAKKVMVEGKEDKPIGNNTVYWIVDVSLKNKEYQ